MLSVIEKGLEVQKTGHMHSIKHPYIPRVSSSSFQVITYPRQLILLKLLSIGYGNLIRQIRIPIISYADFLRVKIRGFSNNAGSRNLEYDGKYNLQEKKWRKEVRDKSYEEMRRK